MSKNTDRDFVSSLYRFRLAIFFLVLLLAIWSLIIFGSHQGGEPYKTGAFYILTALVVGMTFWLLTPNPDGEYTNRQLRIKLGGSAAIAMAFMVTMRFMHSGPDESVMTRAFEGMMLAEVNQQFPGLEVSRVTLRNDELVLTPRHHMNSFLRLESAEMKIQPARYDHSMSTADAIVGPYWRFDVMEVAARIQRDLAWSRTIHNIRYGGFEPSPFGPPLAVDIHADSPTREQLETAAEHLKANLGDTGSAISNVALMVEDNKINTEVLLRQPVPSEAAFSDAIKNALESVIGVSISLTGFEPGTVSLQHLQS